MSLNIVFSKFIQNTRTQNTTKQKCSFKEYTSTLTCSLQHIGLAFKGGTYGIES